MYYTAAVTSAATYYADAMMLEEGTTPSTYFDGSKSSTAQKVYGWSGTPHASASTESSTDFAYVEPVQWQNILGPTSEIQISRKELDVGLLTATLHDALLDPAVANSVVKPGRRMRVMALAPVSDANQGITAGNWYSIYTGKITKGLSEYNPPKGVEVTISASDNVKSLAEQMESSSVANAADLAYTLEGKGVPWNINGSGNQISSASVVAYNANASMLDQISLTRDTTLAKAWVDRNGVLQFRTAWNPTPRINFYDDDPRIASDPAHYLSWSDAPTTYDTDDCINSVTVKWLRYNVGTNQTTEISYGPYEDSAAIAASNNTVYSKEFKICGSPSNEDSAWIKTNFADPVLAANATPVRKVRSLTYPVKQEEHMLSAIANDLYSNVYLRFKVTGTDTIASNHQITGLEHTITAKGWNVSYTFADTGSVAAPVFIPSPPFQGVGVAPGVWQNYTPSIVNMTGSVQRSRWMRVGNTITYQFRIYVTGGAGSTAAITVPVPVSNTYYAFENIFGEHIGEVTILNNSTGYISSGHAYTLGHSGMIIFRPRDNSIEWPGSSLIGAYVQGYVIYEAA
ncbi:hypothetical protein FHU40_004641 [Nocardioides soli]|uniref:Uncharacterized protein n=2 Tax=Nocardioides soli TaxID=1036020 RepID=A0A7W4W0Q8_9ACTN|nr:hypothetical protein [Nocardioides soli]MBB3044804.1 hypothetical protein [Nocardioides soli]